MWTSHGDSQNNLSGGSISATSSLAIKKMKSSSAHVKKTVTLNPVRSYDENKAESILDSLQEKDISSWEKQFNMLNRLLECHGVLQTRMETKPSYADVRTGKKRAYIVIKTKKAMTISSSDEGTTALSQCGMFRFVTSLDKSTDDMFRKNLSIARGAVGAGKTIQEDIQVIGAMQNTDKILVDLPNMGKNVHFVVWKCPDDSLCPLISKGTYHIIGYVHKNVLRYADGILSEFDIPLNRYALGMLPGIFCIKYGIRLFD